MTGRECASQSLGHARQQVPYSALLLPALDGRVLVRRRRRGVRARLATRHACALLDVLDEREQPVPLEREHQLGEHRAVGAGEGGGRVGRAAVEEDRPAREHRDPQGAGVGAERGLRDDGEEWGLRGGDVDRLGDVRREHGTMPKRGERLNEALGQSLVVAGEENRRHRCRVKCCY